MSYFRPALEYIPEDLQEAPLYQTATALIDGVRRKPDIDITLPLDPAVNQLLSGFTDYRAVQAYYNMFVRPSLGTKSALLFALRILNIDAKLVEWFEADFNLTSYKFVLDFADYPATLDLDELIDLVNYLKNERSRLAVIRQPEEFQDMFVTDESMMDDALWDDVSGITYRDVNVFLVKKFRTSYEYPGATISSAYLQDQPRFYSTIYSDRTDEWAFDAIPTEVGANSFIGVGYSSFVSVASGYVLTSTRYETSSSFIVTDESSFDGYEFFASTVSPTDSNYAQHELRNLTVLGTAVPSLGDSMLKTTSGTYADARTYTTGSTVRVETRMTSVVIPRYGLGVGRGSIDSYQVSAGSTMRNESV